MIPTAAALLLALTAAVCELRTGHIPNGLTLPAAPAALALGLYQDRLAPALLGLFVAVVIGAVVYRANLIGGGLVKLGFALGGLVGPLHIAAIAAAVALVFLAVQGARRLRASTPAPMVLRGSPIVFVVLVAVLGASRYLGHL